MQENVNVGNPIRKNNNSALLCLKQFGETILIKKLGPNK